MKHFILLLISLSLFSCTKEKCDSLTGSIIVETTDKAFCAIVQPYKVANVRCAYPNSVSQWIFPAGQYIMEMQYDSKKWMDTINIEPCKEIFYERREK